ncbi:MAG TPA: hypothetical protein VGP13_00620 [Candidatus Paceibacterota bacterium]|nr:hypothetical protein [Candidatus Paceibacterota bacterium]
MGYLQGIARNFIDHVERILMAKSSSLGWLRNLVLKWFPEYIILPVHAYLKTPL